MFDGHGKHKSNNSSSRAHCHSIPGQANLYFDSLVAVIAHQSARQSRSGQFCADNDETNYYIPCTHACGVIIPVLNVEHNLLSGLPDLMAEVAQEEMKSFEGKISECSIVYFPQVEQLYATWFVALHCVLLAWVSTVRAQRRS